MSDSPAGESAFERLPVEILLEIANHCDLTDIFTLRETSKYFMDFASTRSLWVDAAQTIAHEQALCLTHGRTVHDCSTPELKSVVIKATLLHRALRGTTGDLLPKGPSRMLKVADIEMEEEIVHFVPRTGKYVFIKVDRRLSCWDVALGRCIAEVIFDTSDSTSHVTHDENEIILASYLFEWNPVTEEPDLCSIHICIYRLDLHSRESCEPALFTKLISVPIPWTVTTMVSDVRSQVVILVGHPRASPSNIHILLVNLKTLDYGIFDTGVSLPAKYVIVTSTQVALWCDTYSTSEVLLYELPALLNHVGQSRAVDDRINPITLAPKQRVSRLSEGPRSPATEFRRAKVWQNASGAGSAANEYLPVCMTLEEDPPADVEHFSTIICHVFTGIFDPSDTSETGYRQTHRIRTRYVLYRSGEHMIWLLGPGCAAYVQEGVEDPSGFALKLVIFDIRRNLDRALKPPAERTLQVPSFINLERLCDVQLEPTRGRLILTMEDASLFIIDIV